MIRQAVTEWAVGEPLVRRVYLFGSRAKALAGSDSDMDLAILHNVNPKVRPTCDSESQAHFFTWEDYRDRWRAGLEAVFRGRAVVDAWPIDWKTSALVARRGVVVPAVKDHGIRLYRRGR
jgi:hypothetical protein